MSNQKVIEKLKNNPLMPLWHSAEHVLHTAMRELYPSIKLVMGPPVEDGFYFDFDLDEKISVNDFEKIEKRMQEIINAQEDFKMKEISSQEAKDLFKDNEYKLNTLKEIESREEKITVCIMGSDENPRDVDLCMGHHVPNTKNIKAFKLLNVAGAYYKGDEKNKMLQRIYGTAFDSQKKLDEYLEKLELAKERDHRKLGKELELFTFFDEVGPGLPMWLPNGSIIKDELEKWGKDTERRWGYKRVTTPFMNKKTIFEMSGHIDYFGEEMYKVLVPGESEEEYYIKPMNCPLHHMIFGMKPRSYRELPLRLAEYGTVARYENRGALNGILRPRVFCQNDAHVYCSEEQAVDVFVEIINLHRYYYDTLGLDNYHIVLELRDPTKMDKYHGDEEMWQKSERLSKEAMDKAGIDYEVVDEGAAHYGPKMDFKIKSSIGTEYGISTNQIDLYMPQRFGLKYIDKDGNEKPVIVQHRAPLGSHERFVGFLTEHFGGAFPVWLSPVQVAIIPITEKQNEYAQQIAQKLDDKNLRYEIFDRDDTMQAKIREAQSKKIPYMVIVGGREEEKSNVSVRLRSGEQHNNLKLDEFVEKVESIYLTKSLKLW